MTRRAFTLIEVVVVIVILAVIAGVAAPRLLGSSTRAAQGEARAAAALLSVAAHRSALGAGRLAIEHDASARTLTLLRIDSANAGWTPDPLTAPVRLANSSVAWASAAGERLPESWRIEFPANDRRPDLVLVVRSGTGSRAPRVWTIGLPSFATSADLTDGERPREAWPVAIDLDAEGVGDQRW